MFTRLTNFLKDNAELANGYMVLNKGSTPLQGQPKCVTLSQVEAELGNNLSVYAHAITRNGTTKVQLTPSATPVVWLPQRPHVPAVGSEGEGSGSPGASLVASFDSAILGQFLRSHEDTTAVPQCKGLVRPVFEIKAEPGPPGSPLITYALLPTTALWLLASKDIVVPAKGFVFLG